MSEKEKLITAYHEGGHALVAAALPGTDPVHKVTILPRGRALGYTMVLPDEDKYSQTRSEMLDKLAYMLGGRAAEEMVFHDPTTGAGNDIDKATSLARAMVTQFGMTERLGAIKLGETNVRAVPGPRLRAHPELLRGRGGRGRRGDQEAPHHRPPGGLRHPRGEPRRPRPPGHRAAERRRRWTRRDRGLRGAAPPPGAPAWTGSPPASPPTSRPCGCRPPRRTHRPTADRDDDLTPPERRRHPRPPPVGRTARPAPRDARPDHQPVVRRRAGLRPRARRRGGARAAGRDGGGPRP